MKYPVLQHWTITMDKLEQENKLQCNLKQWLMPNIFFSEIIVKVESKHYFLNLQMWIL